MTDDAKKDIDIKLLAGAILGLGIGLVGLLMGLSSGDKAPFRRRGNRCSANL